MMFALLYKTPHPMADEWRSASMLLVEPVNLWWKSGLCRTFLQLNMDG